MSKTKYKPKKTSSKKRKAKKLRMYVMYGFKKSDIDKTAFLQLRKDGTHGKHGIYNIVREEADATRFPSQPLDELSASSFGTPKQWAKFFNEEDELSEWCFHPIAVKD